MGEIKKLEDSERKPELDFPLAEDSRWAQLDTDLSDMLDSILKGDVTKKIKTMVQAVQQVRQDAMKEGRHQQAISRSQEVALTDHIKKPGIAQEKVLKDRKKNCRKKINCKNQRERNVKRENIFLTLTTLQITPIGKPKSRNLICSWVEVKDSVEVGHDDPTRDVSAGNCFFLLPTLKMHIPFNMIDFAID